MKQSKPYSDHKLVTRRDFISQGLVGMTATVFAPALLSPRSLHAQLSPTLSTALPFLVFDLAGGAALPGNFLVGKAGGPEDLLSSYHQLGWNPRASGALDRSYGLPLSVTYSKILQGINATASPGARAKLRLGSICHYSQDDVTFNPLSPVFLIIQAGYRGTYFSSLGTTDQLSGGNSEAAAADPGLKPARVDSVTDVSAALSFGPAFAGFPAGVLTSLGNATRALSARHGARLSALLQGRQLAERTDRAFQTSAGLAAGVPGLDPRDFAAFQQVYDINPGTMANDEKAVSAAIVMNVLRQNSGPGVITIPLCDYHNGTSTLGDSVDLRIGEEIGRAVESAERLGKPLFFHILTDGGVYADDNTRNWRADAGDKSMSVIGYFKPSGAPAQRRLQVGHYTDGQGVERETFIGSDPAKIPYVVLANYLSALGRLGEFERLAPQGMFTNQQIDSMLIFG